MSQDTHSGSRDPRGNTMAQAKEELRREVFEFVKLVFWFLVLFFALKTYVVEGYEVQGPSMTPTLEDEQRILVVKLPHVLSRFRPFRGLGPIDPGDVVVFDSPDEPGKRYVKRVIARGPDIREAGTVAAGSDRAVADQTVEVLLRNGIVYVNNHRLWEDYLRPEDAAHTDTDLRTLLKPGEYFVMGDNRDVSKDSRSFGVVRDEHVIGRAYLCFWPPSQFRLLR